MPDIWERWSAHYHATGIDADGICRDGVAIPERYDASPVKILFVLREANDWRNGDIRQLMADGPRFQVWHTVGRWAAGFLQGFPEYETVDRYATIRDSLQQVAAVNLKKLSGGASSDPVQIDAYAFHDRELLREQIKHIGPTVIVACGTWSTLVWLLELPIHPGHPHRPVRTLDAGTLVIPWCHPNRCDNRKTYAALRTLSSTEPTAERNQMLSVLA